MSDAEEHDALDDVPESHPDDEQATDPPVDAEQLEDGAEQPDEDEAEAAGGSDGEGESIVDSSEEDDEEENNEYEVDDFLVHEAEEDEEDGGGEEGAAGDAAAGDKKAKKKKKKKRRHFELDEEDYALLEDNQVSVKRPSVKKRLKRTDEGRRDKALGPREMKEALFGPDDEAMYDEIEDNAAERGRRGGRDDVAPEPEDDFVEDDDEMGDFIVEGDEQEEGGRPRRRKRRTGLSEDGISARALQEAAAIFGYAEANELFEMHNRPGGAGDISEEEEEEEEQAGDELNVDDFGDDVEAYEEQVRSREARKREKQLTRALRVLDPELVATHHLLPEDQRIRESDVPERLQLLGPLISEPMDCAAAASWIYDRLFAQGARLHHVRTIVEQGVIEVTANPPGQSHWRDYVLEGDRKGLDLSKGRRALLRPRSDTGIHDWRHDGDKQSALRASIEAVLTNIYDKNEEVPLIGMFRKELCGELLALRMEDKPLVMDEDDLRDLERTGRDRDPPYSSGMILPTGRRIRRWEALWTIFDYSLRYRRLTRRKAARSKVLEQAAQQLEAQRESSEGGLLPPALEAAAAAVQECIERLAECNSQQEVDDVDFKFRNIQEGLLAGALSGMSLAAAGGVLGAAARRPQKASKYRQLKSQRLGELAVQVGISASQFGNNLELGFKQNEPTDAPQPPMQLATQFAADVGLVGGLPLAPQMVLDRAKELIALELTAEPNVRAYVRGQLYTRCLLHCTPTEAGEIAIDALHKYGGVKRLARKPLHTLENTDMFLRIVSAAKEGLLEWKIELPVQQQSADEDALLGHLYSFYKSDNVSAVSGEWNSLRFEALRVALMQHIVPSLVQDLQDQLLVEAREVALRRCAESLWKHASRPPLRIKYVNRETDEEEQLEQPRIMACCWGPGSGPGGRGAGGATTVLVMLDGQGNLVDLLQCGQLSGAIPRSFRPAEGEGPGGARGGAADLPAAFTDARKAKDAERIKAKILEQAPNMIVLGASSPQCRQLKEDLERITSYVFEFNTADMRDRVENDIVDVRYADERLAALWENCAAARSEFPEQPAHVRRAIALGRLQLDPLAVLASLCGPRREVLSLSLYDMQSVLSPDEIMNVVDQTLITAVNQVGADLNLIAAASWRGSVLQFVSGLGPRKATHLMRCLQRNHNRVLSRSALYKKPASARRTAREDDEDRLEDEDEHCTIFEKKVFSNCGAFLRVRSAGLPALVNFNFFPLDDTRIHPAMYAVAMELCTMAAGAAGEEVDDTVVSTVMQDPYSVTKVDLHAPSLPSAKLPTLVDMASELQAPYSELRAEGGPLPDLTVFQLLHGESEESLREGRLVEAVVRAVTSHGVRCSLTPSGMDALIPRDLISSRPMEDLSQHVAVGDTLQARIVDVQAEDSRDGEHRYVVRLTTRSADLNNFAKYEKIYVHDENFDYLLNDEILKRREPKESRDRKKDNRQIIPRPVNHPLWDNVSYPVAIDKLKDAEPGSFIMHPQRGRRGLGEFYLTLKLHQSRNPDTTVWKLVLIHEKPRPAGRPSLQLSLPLSIEFPDKRFRVFEDLDEIDVRYVSPMMDNVNTWTSHRKFRDGDRTALEVQLRHEKESSSNVSVAVYCLAMDERLKEKFYILFMATQSCHSEHVAITSEGFWFRDRNYTNLERLLAEFKKNPGASKPQAAAQLPVAQYGYGTQYAAAPNGSAAGAYGNQVGQTAYPNTYGMPQQQGYGGMPAYGAVPQQAAYGARYPGQAPAAPAAYYPQTAAAGGGSYSLPPPPAYGSSRSSRSSRFQ